MDNWKKTQKPLSLIFLHHNKDSRMVSVQFLPVPDGSTNSLDVEMMFPRSLTAVQPYSATSSSVQSETTRNHRPPTVSTLYLHLSMASSTPFLSQVTAGVGFPSSRTSNLAVSPANTFTSLILRINTGAFLGLGLIPLALRNSGFITTLRLGGSALPGVEAVAGIDLGVSGLPDAEAVFDTDLGKPCFPDVDEMVDIDLGRFCLLGGAEVVNTDLDVSGFPGVEEVGVTDLGVFGLPGVEATVDTDLDGPGLAIVEAMADTDLGRSCAPGVEAMVDTNLGATDSVLDGSRFPTVTDLTSVVDGVLAETSNETEAFGGSRISGVEEEDLTGAETVTANEVVGKSTLPGVEVD